MHSAMHIAFTANTDIPSQLIRISFSRKLELSSYSWLEHVFSRELSLELSRELSLELELSSSSCLVHYF